MAEQELEGFDDISASIDAAIDDSGLFHSSENPEPEADAEEQPSSEETEAEEGEAEEGGEQQPDTPESLARQKGWRPKEEFVGDPGEWVDAAEFNRRQPLFDRISKQSKQLKKMHETLDAVVKYQKSQEAKIREKVIAELEAKKREAVEYSDVEAFDAAEAALKQAKEEKGLEVELPEEEFETEPQEQQEQKPAPQQQAPEIPSFVQDFSKANPWFESDLDMQAVMLRRTEMLVSSGKTLEEALPEAKKHVQSVFPDKFRNPKKDRPAPVMKGAAGEQRGTQKSLSDLTPEQRSVWHTLKNTMSLNEFLKSLES